MLLTALLPHSPLFLIPCENIRKGLYNRVTIESKYRLSNCLKRFIDLSSILIINFSFIFCQGF